MGTYAFYCHSRFHAARKRANCCSYSGSVGNPGAKGPERELYTWYEILGLRRWDYIAAVLPCLVFSLFFLVWR